MLDHKQIKRLAKTCREAGIMEFTSPEFSFKLSPDSPVKPIKATGKTPATPDPTPEVNSDGWDSLTDMQKLFYSVGETNESEGIQ